MERRLRHKYSLESNRPGCMWGIFHAFDFNQLFHAGRMMPDKRHRGEKQAGGVKIRRGAGEHDLTEGLASGHLIEEKKKQTSPASKNSGKTCIKTLVAEEMSKEQEQKHQRFSFSARLLRTLSIHHLECSDYELDEQSTICENPIFEPHSNDRSIYKSDNHDLLLPRYPEEKTFWNKQYDIHGATNRSMDQLKSNRLNDSENPLVRKQAPQEMFDEAKKAFSKEKSPNCQGLRRDVLQHPSKESLNALSVFNEKGELFLKILQDRNSIMTKHKTNQHAMLTKCGSFPATELLAVSDASIIKLRRKQKDIHSKMQQEEEKSLNAVIDATLNNLNSSKDNYSKSVPPQSPQDAEVWCSLDSVSESSLEPKKHKQNGVMKCLKDIKKRIKRALRENKKENLWISMDGILHKIPEDRKASKDIKALTYKDGGDSSKGVYDGENANFGSVKITPLRIKRTPSLTESLDRYSQLLESILSRENRMHASEKLKLANEDRVFRGRCPPRTFQRIFSMPETASYMLGRELDSDVLFRRASNKICLDPDAYTDNFESGNIKPVYTVMNAVDDTQFDPSLKTDRQENYIEKTSSYNGDQGKLVLDPCADMNAERAMIGEDLSLEEGVDLSPHGQETGSKNNTSDQLAQGSPNSVLNSYIPGEWHGPAEVSTSEVSMEMKHTHADFSEPDQSVDLEVESCIDGPNGLGAILEIDDVQIRSIQANSNFLHAQVDIMDDADFNYVRDVLNKSGFGSGQLLGMWHSPSQPVDPSLFDEVECLPHNLNIAGPDNRCGHQLLFDLINEVLLEISERSLTYCPWRLCMNFSVCPLPVGSHVLEEAWASIGRHLSSQPEINPPLESIMGQDFAKNDGWMHLQQEAECVGLELEDWILDDLLDEVTLELAAS